MITLEEIAGYFPYKLKCIYVNTKVELILIDTTVNASEGASIALYHHIGRSMHYCGLTSFKPILRPLSDLTREIEHNGGKFMPIVELAKIGIPYKIDAVLFTEVIEDTYALHYESKDEEYVFGFDKDGFYHKCVMPLHALNQLQLFQKLYEWHFDIHGLIEQGDAIDINTL